MDKGRGTGRTTRIIDKAVQDLFANGIVRIEDHHFGENESDHRRATEFAFKKLLIRLRSEHGDQFIFNKNTFTVKVKYYEKRTN